MTHDQKRRMLHEIAQALLAEAEHRQEHDDWVDRERMAVVVEANKWATAYDLQHVTVADVERVETTAMGHVDYPQKLALAVARLIWGES